MHLSNGEDTMVLARILRVVSCFVVAVVISFASTSTGQILIDDHFDDGD